MDENIAIGIERNMDHDNTISNLKTLLLNLKPTGADGFEGLLALVLTELTGTAFNIAQSGTQGGKDGQSALNSGAVAFEAKLYKSGVPADEIITKIAQISVDSRTNTELFVVGSTGPIAAQTAETIEAIGRDRRIATLVLDWPSTGLPPLAVLLAMAKKPAADFIARRVGAAVDTVTDYIDAIRAHNQYSDRAAELRTIFVAPNIAPAYARQFNNRWLSEVFASQRKALLNFGQSLAPADASVCAVRDRSALRQQLAALVFRKPNTKITAILGGDGNGKSWLFSQAWLAQSQRPLTLVIVPDDLKQLALREQDIIELLISKLIEQTGDAEYGPTRERWRRHFERWKKSSDPEIPRLLVFVDGINQRERYPWARFLNGVNDLLTVRGGKLVLSSRRPFFDTIKTQLVDPIEPIEVPEWTNPELEELLRAQGVKMNELTDKVIRSLRNPRIFGIAAKLVHDGTAKFSELSLSRILFEHVRMAGGSDVIAPADFKRDVQQHADEIIERLKTKTTADLRVFDRRSGQNTTSLESRLSIIAAGHIFEEIEGEPTLYSLREDSTPLALGLSLLRTAKHAWRSRHDIASKLSELIDPISALDITADVLLSAIIASVFEEGVAEDVIAALITAYVRLQNLDISRYEEFRSLLLRAPRAFISALEAAQLSQGVVSNLQWLTEAVYDTRQEPHVRQPLMQYAHRWLRMYSLSADRMIIAVNQRSKEELSKEREKSAARISTALNLFSANEKALFTNLVLEDRGNYTNLVVQAFKLLVGLPLASLAEAFRDFCFAAALNGGYHDGSDIFHNLVQLNRVDWLATRASILIVSATLKGPDVSRTGRWALVSLLRATGHPEDAREADEIAEDLTKDREKFKGWRRIEDWCATDPCDPSSEYPPNIDKTASAYAALNVSKLHSAMGGSVDDFFFDDARVGLARFRPDVAIAVMRRFGTDALNRSAENFRPAVFLLEDHSAALDNDGAKTFIAKAKEVASAALGKNDVHNEMMISAEYALMVAFPHITGDDQLEALLSLPGSSFLALSLCDRMRPADSLKFEAALEDALAASDTIRLFRLMAFAEYSETPMTERSREIIADLVSATDDLVRLCAIGAVRSLRDASLISRVVESGWTATRLDPSKSRFEVAVGSDVLVEAASLGLLSLNECLDRIAIEAYAPLVQRLGKEAALMVADRIWAALRKAAGFEVAPNLPEIERDQGSGRRPPMFSVNERLDRKQTAADSFARLAESNEAFYERQKRYRETLSNFERELSCAGADLILYHLGTGVMLALFKYVPDVVRSWASWFMELDERSTAGVRNMALRVAQVIASDDQEAAGALFEKLSKTSSHVTITFGRSAIPLDAMSIWEASDGEFVNRMRFRRLDEASSDFEIATESLAAIVAGKHCQLEKYVKDRRARAEPVYIARAIMVAGFSENTDWAIETIDSHKDDHGLLESAYKAAKFAMDRYIWSTHWTRLMRDAKTSDEFWRNSVILEKIVDGRFDANDAKSPDEDAPIVRFGAGLNSPISNRLKKWKDKRENRLFGLDKPDEIFLR